VLYVLFFLWVKRGHRILYKPLELSNLEVGVRVVTFGFLFPPSFPLKTNLVLDGRNILFDEVSVLINFLCGIPKR
jgi:hypothetical protein